MKKTFLPAAALMVGLIYPLAQPTTAESPRTVVAVSSELPAEQTEALVAMANQAAVEWGHSYPMRLRLVAGNPALYPEGTVAFAGPAFAPGEHLRPHGMSWDCLVGVMPNFWAGNVVQQSLIDHEMGHCLGFEHSLVDEPSIMWSISYGVTSLDRARYRALWEIPAPFRFYSAVSFVAHD